MVLQQLQELSLAPDHRALERDDWDWREHFEFALPPSLSSLHSTLTALKFEGEWSGILPPALPHLTGLQVLHLICRIRPAGMLRHVASLSRLRSLWIDDVAELVASPNLLCQLTALRDLHLEIPYVRRLPVQLFRLPAQLERLKIWDSYELRSAPCTLDGLDRLTSLSLYAVEFTQLPDSLCQLGSLKKLQLVCLHELRILPRDFGCLTSLQELKFVECEKLQELSVRDEQLPALREVLIDWCPLLRVCMDAREKLKVVMDPN